MRNYTSSITKSENGYKVFYRYKAPDGTVKSSCKRGFKLKKDARDWQETELPKLIKQLQHEETLDENLTMSELIDEYMEFTKLRRRSSTAENKENIIDSKIRPYFNKQKVHSITPNDIRKWQDKILSLRKNDGKPLSATYQRTISNQLSAILNYAVTYHNLPSNPVLKIERLGRKIPEQERGYWTLEEYQKFSKAIQDKPEYYYAFEVFFWCGLRLGELLALTKEDVDCEAKTLKVVNSFSKEEKEFGDTKSKSSKRTVHMPDALAEEMKEYMDSLYGLKPQSRIFELSKSALHREMTRGSTLAGVKRIPIHGLRHSHISLLMNSITCASVMDIAKRAGHKTPDITMIYSHRYSTKDQIIAEQLNGIMKGDSKNVSEERGQV